MSRKINITVRNVVSAKLREGGMGEAAAAAMAAKHETAGVVYLTTRAALHSAQGEMKGSYERAINDLSEWALSLE